MEKKQTPMAKMVEWLQAPADYGSRVSAVDKAKELLEEERQMIIDIVNDVDSKNASIASPVFERINVRFKHYNDEGINYFNKKFER